MKIFMCLSVDLKLNLIFIRVKNVCNASTRTKRDTYYMSDIPPQYRFQDKKKKPSTGYIKHTHINLSDITFSVFKIIYRFYFSNHIILPQQKNSFVTGMLLARVYYYTSPSINTTIS